MDEVPEEEQDGYVQKLLERDAPVMVLKYGEVGAHRSLVQEMDGECGAESSTYAQLLSRIRYARK